MLELRKDIFADERDDNLKEIGKPTQRQDMIGHVTGTTTFFDDHKLAGLLHLKVLRSPHHHARIRRIDTNEAERAGGVRRVIRGADVPRNLNTLLSLLNFGKDDEPSLATDKVRYKGEPIVAIVAKTEREAFEALAKVRVDYEQLTPVFDVEEALKPGAPVVNETYPKNTFEYHGKYDHQKLRFGDVERPSGRPITCWSSATRCRRSSTRRPRPTARSPRRRRMAASSSIPARRGCSSRSTPRQRSSTCGRTSCTSSAARSAAGSAARSTRSTEPLATLGSMLTGRPVRYVLGREEEMQFGSPRGAERISIKDGVMKDGRIVARKVRSYFDSGAYTRLSSYAVIKCAAHIPGPYTIPNVHADIYCVYTNRVPATAMRGFGVTAVDFALECQMDKLAHLIGMDPMEFRILNAYRDGDMKAHRREAKNTALIECVQVAAEKARWPIRDEFKRMSSRTAAAARAAIPQTRLDGGARRRRARHSSARPTTAADRAAAVAPQPVRPAASPAAPPPPPRPPRPTPANVQHGATRFSSVFGTRRR